MVREMNEFAGRISAAALGKTWLFSVGQAGYIVKSSSGQLLGIDMYLTDCVERVEGHMGYKRMLPKILFPSELEFDVIITTHSHRDHFDSDAIPLLMANRRTQLYAAADCKKDIRRLEMSDERIQYVVSGESYVNGDFSLHFINCDHGVDVPDAVGVVVSVDGKKILEVGDTCLRLDRKDEYLSEGPFDVMIAPINGTFGNLNERECAQLADILKPKFLVPCHYGMFASHGGNPGMFFNIMKEEYTLNKFLIMMQGECVEI